MNDPMPVDLIAERVRHTPFTHPLTVTTTLRHFAIVTYCVDVQQLRRLVPVRFDLYTITKDEQQFALVSAVNFVDRDFRFARLAPFLRFRFPQTNYRAYVIDRETGEHCAWFFGTALGSVFACIPRYLWKMPWRRARYQGDFSGNYNVSAKGAGVNARLSLAEGPATALDIDPLVLLYPMKGYYHRRDGKLGHYRVWHPELPVMPMVCKDAYFELFEANGLLTKSEMLQPCSALLCPAIAFEIALPPVEIH